MTRPPDRSWAEIGRRHDGVTLALAHDFELKLEPVGPNVYLTIGSKREPAYSVSLAWVDAIRVSQWLLGWSESNPRQGLTESDVRRIVREELAGERP